MKKNFTLHNEAVIRNCLEFIANLDKKKLWRVQIKNADIRTLRQNRYYWAVIGEIADKKEVNKDALHLFFKAVYLDFETEHIDGKEIQILGSTTDLEPSEFIDYTTQCILYAQDNWSIILEKNTG